ncbi:MAG: leucine-rich repeat protein [Muribaculaceae bacterium]|nr:leucine-rich repeat protein [Muribaculaceae bacterium]
MKRLLFIILLIACATLVSHGYIVVDGVHYSTYWAGSVQEAVVVFGDPDDPNNENNYAGLVHANIRDSVSFDGITKLPVTRIGFTAFQWAPDLEEVTIPNTVKTIAEAAFNLCPKLRSITVPNSVVTIEEWGIAHNESLKELHLGSGAVNLDDYAIVGNTALEVITVDENNPVYDSRNNCNGIITTVNNSMVHDRHILFTACSRTVLPREVTWIARGAYQHQGITMVILPAQITNLEYTCFEGCEYLTAIYNFSHDPQGCMSTTFEDYHYENCTLYVPRGTKEIYEQVPVWGSFRHIEEFDATTIIPGDVDGDGEITVADANATIEVIINGGSSHGHTRVPNPDGGGWINLADVNGDGEVNIADINVIINMIFLGQ